MDFLYYKLHRDVYIRELDDLDPYIRTRIMDRPDCAEGKILEQKVDKRVKEMLGAAYPSVNEAFAELK
jgi:hypothetical protein